MALLLAAPSPTFSLEGMVGNQMEPDRGGYNSAYIAANLPSRTYGGVDYLVAKLGPSPRSPRNVANVYAYLLSPSSALFRPKNSPPPANDPTAYYLSESDYYLFHTRVLAVEEHRRALRVGRDLAGDAGRRERHLAAELP